MPQKGTQKTTDIKTEAKADEVIAGYKLQNPKKVEKKKEKDGTWTVTATF